jgi:hypothetical protein
VGNVSDPSGIDPTLRDRVMENIRAVTDALDAAAANPDDDSLDELWKAMNDLMRALGRILIEIERQRSAP